MGCAKVLLITINVIFFLAGVGILAGSLYIRFQPDTVQDYVNGQGIKLVIKDMYTALYVLMGFGGFTLVIALLGCLGAIKESKCLLGMFIAFVVVILAAEFAGGLFAYLSQDEIIKEVKKELAKYFAETYNGTSSQSDKDWNSIMQQLECCGANGTNDFEGSTWSNGRGQNEVPSACCKGSPSTCRSDDAFKIGCVDQLKKFLDDNSVIIIAVAGGIAGFELLVVLLAIYTCCTIKNNDY